MERSVRVAGVAEACLSRPMRVSGPLEGVLTLLAVGCFTVTAVVLVALTRRAGRFGVAGRVGAGLALTGVFVVVVANVVQALVFGGDFAFMPHVVIPGALALVSGLLLLVATVLRADVLPRPATVALLLGSLAMLGFNEQTTAAWLAVPFGLAWVVVGATLSGGRGRGRGLSR